MTITSDIYSSITGFYNKLASPDTKPSGIKNNIEPKAQETIDLAIAEIEKQSPALPRPKVIRAVKQAYAELLQNHGDEGKGIGEKVFGILLSSITPKDAYAFEPITVAALIAATLALLGVGACSDYVLLGIPTVAIIPEEEKNLLHQSDANFYGVSL